MSERGVFAVDRGIWSDPDFADEPFSEREAFLWLVSEAAWRPTRVRIGSAAVELARGQCAFSTRFMAQKWKWSEARVRRYLGRLKKSEIIDAHADAHATHINICKYDRFQRVSLPSDAGNDARPTHSRRTDDAPATQERRKEEDRESREDKEGVSSKLRAEPRTARKRQNRTGVDRDWQIAGDELRDAEKAGLGADKAAAEWPGFIDHHLKVGSQFIDWPAAWRQWARNAVKFDRDAQRRGSRAAPRQSSQDFWAETATDAHQSRQRGSHDTLPFDRRHDGTPTAGLSEWHSAEPAEDGGAGSLSPQQSRADARELPPLRLVGRI